MMFLWGIAAYFSIGLLFSMLIDKWAKEENITFPDGITHNQMVVFITFTWLPFILIAILFPNLVEDK